MLRTIFLLANPLAIDKKNTLTCWTHWNAAKNISCGWKKGSGFISRQSPQWKWKYPEQPNWHVLLHLGQSLAISASSSTIKQLVGLPPGCPKSLDPRTGFFKHDQSVAFNMQISYKATEKTYNKHYLVQNCERKKSANFGSKRPTDWRTLLNLLVLTYPDYPQDTIKLVEAATTSSNSTYFNPVYIRSCSTRTEPCKWQTP